LSFSDYLEKKILDHVFGVGTFTKPANLKIGLSTTPVNDDGTGATEPTDPAYAQVVVDNMIYDAGLDVGFWLPAVTATEGPHEGKGVKASAVAVEFPEAEQDWGTITHFFITDGTNVLGSGHLAQSREVEEGDVVRFKAGELMITLD
jgi:hypothetical protein